MSVQIFQTSALKEKERKDKWCIKWKLLQGKMTCKTIMNQNVCRTNHFLQIYPTRLKRMC